MTTPTPTSISETKAWIQAASHQDLLDKIRSEPPDSFLFQGEIGRLFYRTLSQKFPQAGYNKDNTRITLLVDESGSMANVIDETLSGLNALVKDQARQPGNARLSLTTFSNHSTEKIKDLDIQYFPVINKYHYSPSGYTALYDAIVEGILHHDARNREDGWAAKNIFVIQTDGEENASRHFPLMRVKEEIRSCERQGWTFMFLGANQDTFATRDSLGISSGLAINYASTSEGTQQAYATVSSTLSSIRNFHGVGTFKVEDIDLTIL